MIPRISLFVLIACSCAAQLRQDPSERAAAPTRPAGPPTTQPGEFQPGVRIDWKARAVRVRARVLDVAGPLEFFACGNGKEHESAVLLDARPAHVFLALGLIGLAPGKPVSWEQNTGQPVPASGDLVDLRVEWSHAGRPHEAHWTDWLLDAEYLRRPLWRPFVFAGSLPRGDGRLACETSGAAFALVDMPDALLAPAQARSDRSADLWALANRQIMPPVGAEVTLVLSAPVPRDDVFSLDFLGDFRVHGRFERPGDVAELIRVAIRLGRPTPIRIAVVDTLAADVRRARASLMRFGIPADAVRFAHETTATSEAAPATAPAPP